LTIAFAPVPPQITSVSLDPTNGFVQLTGLGETNHSYGIEAATNLTPPIFWQRLGTNTADGAGLFQFTDTNAPAFLMRFYVRCLHKSLIYFLGHRVAKRRRADRNPPHQSIAGKSF